jgi:glycosyltransferase involved in cell wall biosynthesis
MKYPKISIVTPNYNGGAFLEETILSVLSQNYPNLEYIIIDGGSSDNSISIIKKYESQLDYWVSEPDNGLYDAIQKGFDQSTGEVMAWINSDDLYHPKSFFTVAEIFSSFSQVNWLQGLPSFFDETSRAVDVAEVKRWSRVDYYLGDFKWIQQESVFWRRSLWKVSGNKIDAEMKYAGDLDLWLRFFRYEELYVTTALLGGFRQRSKGQLSLVFLDEYLQESTDRIEEEVEQNISNEERKLVKRINKYKKQANKIPFKFFRIFFNKLIYLILIKNNFRYSSVIIFDRMKQEFKIST